MMMARSKQLNEAERINLDRCYAKLDRVMMDRQAENALVEAASRERIGRCWYVLSVASRGEKSVEKELIEAGIEAWVPVKVVNVQLRHADRMARRERPVFRGYVFVKVVGSADAWAGLRTFRSVRGILCGAKGPTPVRDEKMNDLMGLVEEGVFNERRRKGPFLEGTRVLIKNGPFADFKGVLEGYVGTRSARVMTHLFGGEVVCTVPIAKLAKAA